MTLFADVTALFGLAGTALIVVILLQAFWHKTSAFWEVVGFARDYDLIPESWTAPAVRFLATVEALSILFLLLPLSRSFGALLAGVLFAGYGLAMFAALRAGKTSIHCGCGGPPQLISAVTLGRNAALTLIALGVASVPTGQVAPMQAAAAVLIALTLWFAIFVMEHLDANRGQMRRAAAQNQKKG
ncbi:MULTISPECIES: MauE/DoxX family redox-associated membrane protein [unclassified Yoonia]|uniref:MauE/DoxX family redox-associated membrane protein n=1 Tax=unclassified Yoonia TaxID=2629118 RepID=UPI002AFFF2C9|nr:MULTISPECIES: MauE/DoxX family redox-associated membrane protein [unclassified Yoonia]